MWGGRHGWDLGVGVKRRDFLIGGILGLRRELGSGPEKVLIFALILALFIVLLLQIVLFKVLKKVQ